VAFFLAVILGIVSPKIMTAVVITTVDTHVYSSPRARIAATEPSEEAAILTRLLPTRMAERALSKFSVIFKAAFAFSSPSSAWFSILILLHEE